MLYTSRIEFGENIFNGS